jgi:hypothetical protein
MHLNRESLRRAVLHGEQFRLDGAGWAEAKFYGANGDEYLYYGQVWVGAGEATGTNTAASVGTGTNASACVGTGTSAEISCVKMSEVFLMPLCVFLWNDEYLHGPHTSGGR